MLTRASSIKATDFFRDSSPFDDELLDSLDDAFGFQADDSDPEPVVHASAVRVKKLRKPPLQAVTSAVRVKKPRKQMVTSAVRVKKPRTTPLQVVNSVGQHALCKMHT